MHSLATSRQQTGLEAFTKDLSPVFPLFQTNEVKSSAQSKDNNNDNFDGKKNIDNCPIFLQKTYHMINTCDPTIAEWAEDGQSFVIKDQASLAAKVIPQFFKHSRFSSFVRQLNFYGFRKIRKSPIIINPAIEEMESKYWRFRHRYFVRGQPDLLLEIRKPSQNTVSDQPEVEKLKYEVGTLKNEMIAMKNDITRTTSEIAGLKSLVHKLMDTLNESNECVASSETNTHFKKRRLNPILYSPSASCNEIPATAFCPRSSSLTSTTVFSSISNQTSSSINDAVTDNNKTVDFDKALYDLGSGWEDKILTGLDFSTTEHADIPKGIDNESKRAPIEHASSFASSSATSNVANTKDNILDPDFLRRLSESIGSKSRNTFCVEKLYSDISKPVCFEKQVNDLSAFVSTATMPMQNMNSQPISHIW